MPRAVAAAEKTRQLERGAKGIESLVSAAHKRVKLGEDALALEREKAETEKTKMFMSLFAMPGTDQNDLQTFISTMQAKALKEITFQPPPVPAPKVQAAALAPKPLQGSEGPFDTHTVQTGTEKSTSTKGISIENQEVAQNTWL